MSERLRHFEECANANDGSFRGHYSGRGWHEGIAIDFDGTDDLVRFVADASQNDELRELLSTTRVHTDSMGLGIVASWDRRAWTEEEWELAPLLADKGDRW